MREAPQNAFAIVPMAKRSYKQLAASLTLCILSLFLGLAVSLQGKDWIELSEKEQAAAIAVGSVDEYIAFYVVIHSRSKIQVIQSANRCVCCSRQRFQQCGQLMNV